MRKSVISSSFFHHKSHVSFVCRYVNIIFKLSELFSIFNFTSPTTQPLLHNSKPITHHSITLPPTPPPTHPPHHFPTPHPSSPHPPKPQEAEQEWSEVPSDVVHLNDDNFNDVIKHGQPTLVMFYAPCEKCHSVFEMMINIIFIVILFFFFNHHNHSNHHHNNHHHHRVWPLQDHEAGIPEGGHCCQGNGGLLKLMLMLVLLLVVVLLMLLVLLLLLWILVLVLLLMLLVVLLL